MKQFTGKSQLARINGDNNLIAITEMHGCPLVWAAGSHISRLRHGFTAIKLWSFVTVSQFRWELCYCTVSDVLSHKSIFHVIPSLLSIFRIVWECLVTCGICVKHTQARCAVTYIWQGYSLQCYRILKKTKGCMSVRIEILDPIDLSFPFISSRGIQ